ncbi:hypothetical protein VI817_007110 [Penicillium citrinum]|nr:hypothetical protein VI817_007110 [Penicillium citrinum]
MKSMPHRHILDLQSNINRIIINSIITTSSNITIIITTIRKHRPIHFQHWSKLQLALLIEY